MKKEIADKWIKALQSGDYKQTRGKMSNCKGGYCCLGVLSDIYAKEKKVEFEQLFDAYPDDGLPQEYETENIPYKVINWAGFCQNVNKPISRFQKIKGKISEIITNRIQKAEERIRENPNVFNSSEMEIGNNTVLAAFNDEKVPFKSIAKFIEANWETL